VNFGGVVWSLPLKIFLDQTFFASYLNAAYCFCIEAMQRRPLREIGRREVLPARILPPGGLLHACSHPAVPSMRGATPALPLQVRSSWWPSLKASWRFWPIAHAFTYSVVPLHLRVLWVDVLEIVWVAILSSCVASTQRLPAVVDRTAHAHT
jgi:protein Mpv17